LFIDNFAKIIYNKTKVKYKLIKYIKYLSSYKGAQKMQIFKEKYIINEKGEKTAAILPIKKYEELVEDLHDLAIVAERRDESIITFDKLKERYKKKWSPMIFNKDKYFDYLLCTA